MTTADQDFRNNKFVVVANRLPVDLTTAPDGTITALPSPGGLVTALAPVLESHQGCWVGWPGMVDQDFEPFRTEKNVLLYPVSLSQCEYEEFYEGFSNATLWPLYHNLIVTPVYKREWWARYREVNLRFAEAVAEVAAQNALVWVQDYQLQLVPGILRQLRPDLTIGFFNHIPFPNPDLFRQLPWREEIIRGLLGADLLGFHLKSDADHFLELASRVNFQGSQIGQPDSLKVVGTSSIREVTAWVEVPGDRKVGVAAFPISIDTNSVVQPSEASIAKLRAELGDPSFLLLGVDRMDYTKGILHRLRAFEELLRDDALPENTVLLQFATPSRERIDHYQHTRAAVEQAVGRINGSYGRPGHPVVEYYHRSLLKEELAAYYAAADVMLVTPLKDGMNLVAKEYIAYHPAGHGALVLSEFAGAAYELEQAYICNPFDLESLKRQMRQAVLDLKFHPEASQARINAMYNQVQNHNVDLWASSFVTALGVEDF
ncbi:alpha,alpha-trehalose-phosphate synthase (UDP-forming) [Corynebacterium caspium]|uniref:alpha,alpha-trehalose-phosphate synthase (UDP-forming) n=1 Tax=Corynebacterium caspium TaxID=234828 RepID=UPI000365151D|nr:trehalose-6-phosphate synthase [Corynebacterium caspium]WKD58721.1 Trehalose-phosphate synthase [Corynebacterium caspium DSM 44850]